MRSRSSRLFIVLLHLVGVSTNLGPRHGTNRSSGIVGVNPTAILLESLDLKAAGGLDGLLQYLSKELGFGTEEVEEILSEPFWLQDDIDGKCLGPEGFSECGDATLWLIRRRPRSSTRATTKIVVPGDAGQKKRRAFFATLFKRKDKHQFEDSNDDEGNYAEWLYALELIDISALPNLSPKGLNKTEARHEDSSIKSDKERECMIGISRFTSSRRRKRNSINAPSKRGNSEDMSFGLGPCSLDEAWIWHINGDGVLLVNPYYLGEASADSKRTRKEQSMILFGGPLAAAVSRMGSKSIEVSETERGSEMLEGVQTSDNVSATNSDCLWRVDATSAILAPCNVVPAVIGETQPEKIYRHVVSFSFVRYEIAAALSLKLPLVKSASLTSSGITYADSPIIASLSTRSLRGASKEGVELFTSSSAANVISSISEFAVEKTDHSHLPRTIRTSQSHAAYPFLHSELKLASRLLFSASPAAAVLLPKNPSSFNTALKNTVSSSKQQHRHEDSRTSVLQHQQQQNRHLLHRSTHNADRKKKMLPGGGKNYDDAPHKPRKIPTHPYIASAEDGIWEDPQTGLKYLTDLSEYLGHDRKVTGRHTLMGVGQYMRTMLKIKVYGVALYVSKRDVLADADFVPYAGLNSEELRTSDGFLDHLMKMPSDPTFGTFDRTLLFKLNMQLSTETMRSSLEADWKMLTAEHKQLLIDSSFKSRPAEEAMLGKIVSDENSSNCSCGQSAPVEYLADPTCCARGTEIVFTWRKNGDMEVRVDGRVMDTFPCPELAKGIFYEYLRGDDPISTDARHHFTDGFPFLLAPLAQVKGVSSPVRQSGPVRESASPSTLSDQYMLRFGKLIGSGIGVVSNQANLVSSWVRGSSEGMISTAASTLQMAGDSAQGLMSEMNRRRTLACSHMMILPGQSSRLFSWKIPLLRQRDSSGLVQNRSASMDNEKKIRSLSSRGKILGSQLARLFGDSFTQTSTSNEMGVIMQPSMGFTQMLFSTMVHFYLMLLLIVSVPGSYTTRLIAKRSSASTVGSGSASEQSTLCRKGKGNKNDGSSGGRRSKNAPGLFLPLCVSIDKSFSQSASDYQLSRDDTWINHSSEDSEGSQEEGESFLERSESDDDQQVYGANPKTAKIRMKKALSYFL